MQNRTHTQEHPSDTQPFACARCGACCRQAGEVRLRPDEIEPIARFLNMTAHEFAAAYTNLRPDRCGLILTETQNGACIFITDNLCRIQPVKPRQCRAYPHAWHIPGEEQFCRARRRPA